MDEAPGRIQQVVLGAPDALRDRALRTADAFDGGVFALGFAAALVVVSGGTTLLAREAGAFFLRGAGGYHVLAEWLRRGPATARPPRRRCRG